MSVLHIYYGKLYCGFYYIKIIIVSFMCNALSISPSFYCICRLSLLLFSFSSPSHFSRSLTYFLFPFFLSPHILTLFSPLIFIMILPLSASLSFSCHFSPSSIHVTCLSSTCPGTPKVLFFLITVFFFYSEILLFHKALPYLSHLLCQSRLPSVSLVYSPLLVQHSSSY